MLHQRQFKTPHDRKRSNATTRPTLKTTFADHISCLAFLLRLLSLSPFHHKPHMIGIKQIDKNPNRLLPQSMPNVVNICVAKSGKHAPKHDLKKSLPADIEAKDAGYASPR